MKRRRILIADDHAIVLEGLRFILEHSEFEVVGAASDGRGLLQAAITLRPDVIITDVVMPILNGIDAAREIRRHDQNVKVVFLSMHSEVAYAVAALAAGASAYVLKSAANDELILAIRSALAGRTYVSKSLAQSVERAGELRPIDVNSGATQPLTIRQREVLQLLAEGKQVKEIAAVLSISPKTVEFHKYRVMELLGLRTVADLARYAQKLGIVE